jgi:hypothetical protein
LARFIADSAGLKQVDPIVYEDSQVSAGTVLSEKTTVVAHYSHRQSTGIFNVLVLQGRVRDNIVWVLEDIANILP